ncbi:hypothetical protein QBC34DRAFT_150958 [Podospora aff. communis PSN243]|uniref:Uncharacterized protein n=1 Tax=Podospora aff. communis PSN243 TaxID=3040156 RepID=A0AAV9GFW6_9PEZI|nr:hypothetical protein QBC34DRAFT_150958 [Podospora aff. communis PSN243]
MHIKSFFSSRRPSWGSHSSEESYNSSRRSLSGASSHLWRPRSNPRRPSLENPDPQVVAGGHIDRAKLTNLLDRRFGKGYELKVRSDGYRIHAPGTLADDEIRSCARVYY